MDWLSLYAWILTGAWAVLIYQQKGWTQIVGLIGSFLLGPLGLIINVFSRDNNKIKAEQEIKKALVKGELKVCPYCAEFIKPAARVCRYCGRDL